MAVDGEVAVETKSGGKHRKILKTIRARVAVAGVVRRDAIVAQIDTELSVVVNRISRDPLGLGGLGLSRGWDAYSVAQIERYGVGGIEVRPSRAAHQVCSSAVSRKKNSTLLIPKSLAPIRRVSDQIFLDMGVVANRASDYVDPVS